MSNGSNDWDVKWIRISFLQRILDSHENVTGSSRSRDILFTVDRGRPIDNLQLFCCDEYVCGLAAVRRALVEFGPLNIIFVGGVWNGYTREAKQYCLDNKIGLYNASELSGGLWKKEFWDYAKKDDDGNPIYAYKAA